MCRSHPTRPTAATPLTTSQRMFKSRTRTHGVGRCPGHAVPGSGQALPPHAATHVTRSSVLSRFAGVVESGSPLKGCAPSTRRSSSSTRISRTRGPDRCGRGHGQRTAAAEPHSPPSHSQNAHHTNSHNSNPHHANTQKKNPQNTNTHN